jgi:methylated-DNA-[protein]-cysteine S-methyltransferase
MNAPTLVQARWPSPLGPLTLAATDAGLAGVWFDAQTHHPGELAAPVDERQPWIIQAREQLAAYFAGSLRRFSVPLDLRGTPFQRAVWQALQDIGAGSTRTYSQIAALVGSPAAVRAAGAAIGRNPVSIIVPCHRVIGRSGGLTGYAGGLPRKQALLQLEGVMTFRQESKPNHQGPAAVSALASR